MPATPALNAILLAANAMTFHTPDKMSWLAWGVIIVIALCCLFLSAFVSGSEIAYFGITRREAEELEESDDPRDKTVTKLLSDPERLLATILITNNLVNITLVVLLNYAINAVVTFNSTLVNFLVQTVFLTFLLLLFGEIFPKLVARGRQLRWARMACPGVDFLYRIFGPLARTMVKSTVIVNKIVTKKKENISTDELEKALEISDVKEGKDKEMLEGILSFGELDARAVMISRVDVTAIECHDSWDDAIRIILESGYSRIPVYDTNQDSICGILYSKDLLPYIGKKERPRWQTLLREAYFVPESRMLDDLLEDFRKKKIHIAIVIDEYGCTRGIVTLEDIIEQIVGDIDDEYDEVDSMYRRISPGVYEFEGKIPIVDFCHILDIPEDDLGDIGDAETLAGLLLEIKGDFPSMQETLSRGRLRFHVMSMEKRRIMKVKTVIAPATEAE